MAELERKVKQLRSKNQYQSAKIDKLSTLLNELEEKRLLEKDTARLLQSSFSGTLLDIFSSELSNSGRSSYGRRYSDSVKQFALTLHYYSPQAYEYCRSIFSLPHVSSLRNWISSSAEGPGFLSRVIDAYSMFEKDNVDCSLVIDAMSLHKQLQYCNGAYVGYVDYGGIVAEDSETLASEVLVFLLVPLRNSGRHYPVGYFFSNKTNSTVQTNLVLTLLQLTAAKGIQIRCITSDGAAANQAMYSNLGCDMNPINPSPYFTHPHLPFNVYATLDACHMLKLARNALADIGLIVAPVGLVNWSYIDRLVKLQSDLGLRLGNKLTPTHIAWRKAKMKVRLAAQTLSTAVADSLQFLSQMMEEFADVGETVNFIKMVTGHLTILCLVLSLYSFIVSSSLHMHRLYAYTGF